MDITQAAVMFWRELQRAQELTGDYRFDDDGWGFGFNKRKSSHGLCKYSKQRIELSAPCTRQRDPEAVRNTIRHEIAHMLTPGAKHGPEWRRVFRMLGGDGERCSSDPVSFKPKWVAHVGPEVVKKYQGKPRKDLSRSWIRGRKSETQGKIQVTPWRDFVTLYGDQQAAA